MSEKIKIGLFGFGVVGQGLYDVILGQDLNLELIKIAIKNPEKKEKPGSIVVYDESSGDF